MAAQDESFPDDPAVKPKAARADLARLPITFDLRALSLLEGLRAGVAIAVTMAVASLLNVPALGVAALGALEACLADTGGPISLRLPILASFGIGGAVLFGGFGLLRNEPMFIVVPVATLAIFCLTFLRVYGQAVQQLGNMLCVVVILALDHAVSAHTALIQGLRFLSGAAWAMALTLLVWRIRPYGPARAALGRLARRLADLADDLNHLAWNAESQAEFDTHARAHRNGVRDAIEQARAVSLDTLRQRGNASARANQLAVRLASFEHLFSLLIAISETIAEETAARRRAAPALRLLSFWLAMIGPEIEADRSLDTQKRRRALDQLQAEINKLDPTSVIRHLLDAAAERLAVLVTASTPAGAPVSGEAAPQAWLARLRVRLMGPLRANLSWQSVPLRHTMRVTLVIAPLFAFTLGIDSPFAHWLTITLIFTMQPYFSTAWVRALERIGGTALGGAIAAVISFVCHTKPEVALTMIPLTILAFAIRGVSFAAFIAVLTPVVVLLVEQLSPGADQLATAEARVGFTLAGGLLSVAANLFLFPGFEATRLDAARQAGIAAHRAWLDLVFESLIDQNSVRDEAVEAARRQAGLSSNNLEASISRALLEPHRRRDPLLGSAILANAALRRMAGRLTVLALDRPVVQDAAKPAWRAWRDWLDALLATSRATAARPALPDVAPDVATALTRLARQAELIVYGENREHGDATRRG